MADPTPLGSSYHFTCTLEGDGTGLTFPVIGSLFQLTATELANGVSFANTDADRVFFVVRTSTTGGTLTVTALNQTACSRGYTTEHNKARVIAQLVSGQSIDILGVFKKSRWNSDIGDATDRVKVTFDYSAADPSPTGDYVGVITFTGAGAR